MAIIDTGSCPPSFFLTKKKLETAGDVDGWINSCERASVLYSSMARVYGIESGYIQPFGSVAPGSRSIAQSHGLWGGSLVAAD